METVRMSLSEVVERWLTPRHAVPFRVRPLRSGARCRGVQVQARAPGGEITLCFFRHDDGVWRVFPQLPHGLTMRAA